MFEICCVLQGMLGGYPPGLPTLQGPVDGIISMGSMPPLHPGVPPPHQLPPGMPGIPPPGKNDLIHSLSRLSVLTPFNQLPWEMFAACAFVA